MGLSASCYNLLKYTERKNDIGCQLMRISTQKQALTRDMQKLTKKYQTEMNTKTLKWTNNGGYDYKDLSYATLMSPKGLNNRLYMITDMNGRVVVDSKYRKYAEMISEDGKPGGKYDEETRNKILGGLLGKDPDDIGNALNSYNTYLNKKTELSANPKPEPNHYHFYHSKMSDLKNSNRWSSFNGGDVISNDSDLQTFLSQLISASEAYFPEPLSDAFNTACQNVNGLTIPSSSETSSFTKDKAMTQFIGLLGSVGCWYDVDDDSYQTYLSDLYEWDEENGDLENEMNDALAIYEGVFDSNTMAQADFYDELFSSIADNGWSYYDNLDDPDYLNNMFLNGLFNITTVDRTCTEGTSGYTYDNEYHTEPALNCENIVQVNDKDHNNQVYILYEAERDKIKAKEEVLDRRQQNLETEQAALKEMIESVKNVMDKNVENHFNIFG